jgi:predicted lactoylglutathione lyase
MDEGPMYGGSFADPDGHAWEVVYMDMSQVTGSGPN